MLCAVNPVLDDFTPITLREVDQASELVEGYTRLRVHLMVFIALIAFDCIVAALHVELHIAELIVSILALKFHRLDIWAQEPISCAKLCPDTRISEEKLPGLIIN